MKIMTALALFAIALSGCGPTASDSSATAMTYEDDAAAVEIDAAIYAAALANPARPDADRERDAGRRPAEVLEFFGITPGMVVLDIFSGGGYYTEIIAAVVGNNGRVVAHSSKPYLKYVGEEFALRHADNRLPNVDVLMAENNELSLDAGSFDAVTMILAYHDTYEVDEPSGWYEIDIPKFLAELRQGLKPGGIVGIIDHAAETGAPSETGGTIHRIDPAIVIADMQAAGFELEAGSDILRNPEDDLGKSVFAPETRGKTDRFVLLFRKPN